MQLSIEPILELNDWLVSLDLLLSHQKIEEGLDLSPELYVHVLIGVGKHNHHQSNCVEVDKKRKKEMCVSGIMCCVCELEMYYYESETDAPCNSSFINFG